MRIVIKDKMMHPETCPCCYENTYKIEYPSMETPLEPAEGYCSNCGFHWQDHCKHPEREQVLAHREQIKRQQRANIDWAGIAECDKVLGITQSKTTNIN